VSDPDLGEIARRAAAAAGAPARVAGLRRLPGGVSSLTYAARLTPAPDADGGAGERAIVVKVAPPGLAPVRNRDVLRQARALRRLRSLEGFPVPAVEFEDAGDPPVVPPLFGMQLCPGQSYEPGLDVSPNPPDAATAAERIRVAARALARLQAVTPSDLGLDDEPMPPAEELARWQRLFATVDADIGVGHEKLHARLAERIPAGIAPRMLHGDYRLANMLFTGSTLEAVIDWEIWSVGDPRSDLAWLLMHSRPAHVFHEDRSPAERAAASALPSPEELQAVYLEARRDLGAEPAELDDLARDVDWFLGVCLYKTAATIAVIHKRDRKRSDPDPSLAVAAGHLPDVLARGHEALDRAADGGAAVR
jgi:aminoglycoside phosphotransferase (APT) family kinase protein